MKCPVCRTHEHHSEIDLHAEGFAEDIVTCHVCGTVWSITHGMTGIVRDSQEQSFLSALAECVEGADYSLAA